MAFQPNVESTWSGDDQLEWLITERTLSPEDTPFELGKRDLYGYFPAAVRSVAQLAMHSSDDKVRLNASRFIVDTVAKLEVAEQEGKDGPLDKFIKNITDFANNAE